MEAANSKYLGITLQSNLKWNKHINSITNKANQSLGFLKRNLKIKSSDVKSHAYKALVRPKLEYASAVWDPHTRTQINQINHVLLFTAPRITLCHTHQTYPYDRPVASRVFPFIPNSLAANQCHVSPFEFCPHAESKCCPLVGNYKCTIQPYDNILLLT